jgi:protein transport protein SEC23
MYGNAQAAGAGQAIFTDDVSLQVFMEHLKRLVRISVFSIELRCIYMRFSCQAVGAQTN